MKELNFEPKKMGTIQYRIYGQTQLEKEFKKGFVRKPDNSQWQYHPKIKNRGSK